MALHMLRHCGVLHDKNNNRGHVAMALNVIRMTFDSFIFDRRALAAPAPAHGPAIDLNTRTLP